ncbi:MAG: tetratricopeptide repeat protein [Planctomycetota bacterium]
MFARAKGFADKSQFDRAQEILTRLIEADSAHSKGRELRGYCYMKLGRYADAISDFERGLPGASYHDLNRAYCLKKVGRLKEALVGFRRALKGLGPTDDWTVYVREQILRMKGVESARALLVVYGARDHAIVARGKKELARASGGGEAWVILDPFLPEAPLELNVTAISLNGPWGLGVRVTAGDKELWHHHQAFPARSDVIELSGVVQELRLVLAPGDRAGEVRLAGNKDLDFPAASLAAERAERGWDLERPERGLEQLREAAFTYPGLLWFPRRLAERLEEQIAVLGTETTRDRKRRKDLRREADAAWGDWLTATKRLAELVPGDPLIGLKAATAAANRSDHGGAESGYRAALKRQPQSLEALTGLALALARQGKGKEAVEIADRCVSFHPRATLAHVARGDALLAADRADAALNAYQRAVELDPPQAEWLSGKIAAALNREGPNGLAIRKAEEKAGRSADAAAIAELGAALLRGLRYEEAIEVLEQSFALSGGAAQPGALARAGLAAELAGKARQAVDAYERAAKQAPQSELGQMAARRRQRLLALSTALRTAASGTEGKARPGLERAKPAALREAVQAAIAKLEVRWPRLASGLRQLPPLRNGSLSEVDVEAVRRIAELAKQATGDPELAFGLKLLERSVSARKVPVPVLDGAIGDWMKRDRLAQDPKGDQRGGSASDLAELYGVVVGDHLYVMLRTYGPPSPGGVEYWVEVRAEPLYGTIAAGVSGDGPRLIRALPGRPQREIAGDATGVTYGTSKALEVAIPLRWLKGSRRVRLSAFTFDGTKKLDEMAGDEPVPAVDDGYAPGILSLFHLARGGPFVAKDRLAVAVALGSADRWAIGSDWLHSRLAADDRTMYELGHRLSKAHQARGWTPLAEVPLEALVVWADRSTQIRPASVAGYLRFSVSPGVLRAMGGYLLKRDLVRPSLPETVQRIERYLSDPRRWQYTSAVAVERGARVTRAQSSVLSSEEQRVLARFVRDAVVDGMKVNTDGHFTQDLAFDYLVANDALLGHCGNMAQLTVDLCRSLGIPATIVQGKEEGAAFESPHAFATYYDAERGAWGSVQGARYKGARPLTTYVFLPTLVRRSTDQARPSGAGTLWYREQQTYDEVGRRFQQGYAMPWFRKALAGE